MALVMRSSDHRPHPKAFRLYRDVLGYWVEGDRVFVAGASRASAGPLLPLLFVFGIGGWGCGVIGNATGVAWLEQVGGCAFVVTIALAVLSPRSWVVAEANPDGLSLRVDSFGGWSKVESWRRPDVRDLSVRRGGGKTSSRLVLTLSTAKTVDLIVGGSVADLEQAAGLLRAGMDGGEKE